MNKNKILSLFNDKILNCKRCDTKANKNIGYGNIDSQVMFVAQNPRVIKAPECETLIYPFDLNLETPTSSGKYFLRLVKALGVTDYYLTNVMKCSTPKNRAPEKGEIKQCSPYLEFELKLQQPKVIFFLGNPASLFYDLYGCDILKKIGIDPKIYRLWHPSFFLYRPAKVNEWMENAEDIALDLPKILGRK